MSKQNFIFDLHLDLEVYYRFPKFLNMKFKNLNLLDLKRHGDIPQFTKGNLKLAVVNIFPFEYYKNEWVHININQFFARLEKFLKWLSKYKIFKIIYNKNDLNNILKSKYIGIILGVEGLNFLEKYNQVFLLYEKGIRVIGLNWNKDTKFSTSLKNTSNRGLNEEGINLIKTIEKLPIVIDLAHSSITTFKDILKIYKKPVIFSHNGIKEVVDFEQNLDKSTLNLLRDTNGLIGLTCLPYSIDINNKISFENWYKSFKYIKKEFKNNLAIGTDFFGFKFNENHNGTKNFLDFSSNLKKFKIPSYVLFKNAFNLFVKVL
ncbi:MAG: hypothetical protein KatS3mg095_0694 [Candidatus Parcubacteria bacterium]|nr:MAG: hypothetical protein KatS3mg095_0694 [Candidatus Parcubacteria bacterium]